jgi:hypothetical protein
VASVLPAPVEVPVVSGEVIDPMDTLRKQEKVIRTNFRKMETVVGSVARALNIIYHNDLWKLHKTADGKRRYTNFNDYLSTEFGWDKTAARARQIMKADLPLAIEAGEVPKEVGDKRRNRAAPEITALKAAQVTVKQLETVLNAWNTRMENVENGAGFDALSDIFTEATHQITDVLGSLNTFIADQSAESESASEDEDESDEDGEGDES